MRFRTLEVKENKMVDGDVGVHQKQAESGRGPLDQLSHSVPSCLFAKNRIRLFWKVLI